MALGRPSDYSPELADAICNLLIEGNNLRDIGKTEGFPHQATILRWVVKHADFREQYARALEARTDAHAEELLDIADNASNDWMETNDKDNPGYRENGEAIRRSQVRIDTRKWLMSKFAPKKYGDKQTLAHTDGDGKPLATGPTIILTGAPPGTLAPETVAGASKPGD